MISILIIIPYYYIYPPINGGMQRCFNILHQLAKHFAVTVIINQEKIDFQKATIEYPALSNVKVYSTENLKTKADIFSLLPERIKNALRYRCYQRTWRSVTDSNFLLYYPILKNLLTQNHYQVLLLENLDTINAVNVIRRYSKNVRIVYDAHNVGYRLAEQEVKKGLMKPDQMLAIRQVESNFYTTVDAVLTCSETELKNFQSINNQKLEGAVIPNGVQLPGRLYDEGVQSNEARFILFCGSLNYEPNTEGLYWFYREIWPLVKAAFPKLKLLVVGSGELPGSFCELVMDKQWIFTGKVDDVKPYYDKATVVIVPLKSGSGTRLKILEAMGLGIPVISTTKGAEGINYTDQENIVIADEVDLFAKELAVLLEDKTKRNKLQKAASLLVSEQYNWDTIGDKLSLYLKNLTAYIS